MRKLFSFFNKLHWNYKSLLYFLAKEKKNKVKDVSLRDKLWLWRHGFNSFHKERYGLTSENIHEYISSYHYKKYHTRYNSLFIDVIDNKALLPFILPDELVCELCLIFEDGKFTGANVPVTGSVESFIMKELETRQLICKPVRASLGMGVMILTKENVKRVLGFTKLKKRSVIITEKIENMAYAKRVFPDAGNSIRLYLIRNTSTGQLELLSAIHKFGSKKTAPADHMVHGGIGATIEPETGVLLKTRIYVNGKAEYLGEHPDTGVKIEGLKIPNWNRSINRFLELLNRQVWIRYTGVDAILTETGFKILELNSLPDLEYLQEEFPVMANPVTKSFFAEAGHKQLTQVSQ